MTNINTILDEAQFLCDRLSELDWSRDYDDFGNDYYGHVDPSHSRLKQWLGGLPDTPVAAGCWKKVGTFEPGRDTLYLVQGTLCLSVKRGAEIDPDNLYAAEIVLV